MEPKNDVLSWLIVDLNIFLKIAKVPCDFAHTRTTIRNLQEGFFFWEALFVGAVEGSHMDYVNT